MICWTYDPETGALRGETTADESPLEPGVFLVPAHATMTAPPAARDGFGRVFTGGAWTEVALPAPTVPEIAAVKAGRVAEAWAALQARIATATVSVTTTAGTHTYGLDAVTQDNLQKALLGVLAGLSPDPRPWTPKGSTAPIAITHDEVRAIAGAVGLAYEGHVQAYLAHKLAIAALTTLDAVAHYDLTQGWPPAA